MLILTRSARSSSLRVTQTREATELLVHSTHKAGLGAGQCVHTLHPVCGLGLNLLSELRLWENTEPTTGAVNLAYLVFLHAYLVFLHVREDGGADPLFAGPSITRLRPKMLPSPNRLTYFISKLMGPSLGRESFTRPENGRSEAVMAADAKQL